MRRKTFDLIASWLGVVFLALSVFGFLHMRRTPAEADLQATRV